MKTEQTFPEDETTRIFRPGSGDAAGSSPASRPRDKASDSVGRLWDANDVAKYLKVSRSWVYHRAEAGLLPYLRVGGLLRFDPDSVRNFSRKK